MNFTQITLTAFFLFCGLTACREKNQSVQHTGNTTSDTTSPTAPKGMIWIPGGTYRRGNDHDPGNLALFLENISDPLQRKHIQALHYVEERPAHPCTVDGFFMDATEVTNAQFAQFVAETGHITMAEKGLSQKDFPLAPADALAPGANVYTKPQDTVDPRTTQNSWRWWAFTQGANWRHPQGPGSSIKDKMDHPVVCVNYHDAAAYAQWAGKRLPTEAEWERAARGGHEKRMFTWGNTMQKNKQWLANCFQGNFPNNSTAEDGFHLSAPVKSFPPNDYGLYDMAGNVWEICSDYYHPRYYELYIVNPTKNPTGPTSPLTEAEQSHILHHGVQPHSTEPSHPLTHLRTMRGGSFLCHFSYCLRFRPAARHYHEPLTPSHHTGFRCVMDAPSKN